MNALFLRDFDAERAIADAVPDTEPEQPVFSFSEEELNKMLAEAREEGHQMGLAEGERLGREAEAQSLEADAVKALHALHPQLEAFVGQDKLRRAEMQQDIVELFLDVAERVAPDFLAAHSTEMVQTKVIEALNLGAKSSKITVTLSPETHGTLAQAIASLPSAGDFVEVAADPDFTNAQAHVTWDNGFLDYNLDDTVAALLSALRIAAHPPSPQSETEKV